MIASSIVVAITVAVLLLQVLLHEREVKQHQDYHGKRLHELLTELELHTGQMKARNKGLDRYDFLRYNLSDALVIQPQISMGNIGKWTILESETNHKQP